MTTVVVGSVQIARECIIEFSRFDKENGKREWVPGATCTPINYREDGKPNRRKSLFPSGKQSKNSKNAFQAQQNGKIHLIDLKCARETVYIAK